MQATNPQENTLQKTHIQGPFFYQSFINDQLIFQDKRLQQQFIKITESSNQEQKTPWRTMIDRILGIKGYSKAKIAREVGVSRRTVNRWYSGEIEKPHNIGFSRLFRLYCHLCVERVPEYASASA